MITDALQGQDFPKRTGGLENECTALTPPSKNTVVIITPTMLHRVPAIPLKKHAVFPMWRVCIVVQVGAQCKEALG